MDEAQEVKVEVPIELCYRIIENLKDSIERLETGTNSLDRCHKGLSELVFPGVLNFEGFND